MFIFDINKLFELLVTVKLLNLFSQLFRLFFMLINYKCEASYYM